MIGWITGNTGAGKTFLADTFFTGFIKIDEDRECSDIIFSRVKDDVRDTWNLEFSKEVSFEITKRITHLVELLHKQGFDIVVSVICPFQEIRDWVTKEINPYWIYIEHESKKQHSVEVPKTSNDPNNSKNLVKYNMPYEIPEYYDMKLKSRKFKHIDIDKIRSAWQIKMNK